MPADSGAVPAAELKLKSLVPHDLATAGLEFTTQALEHEDAATAICEQAGHFGADMICMGSHGHSATATILLGSVVQNVIARSQRPVLVVSPPRT
jgi:nucleotide-binding universal stress UspA family protein